LHYKVLHLFVIENFESPLQQELLPPFAFDLPESPNTAMAEASSQNSPSTHHRPVHLQKRRPSGAVDFLPFAGPRDRRLKRNHLFYHSSQQESATGLAESTSKVSSNEMHKPEPQSFSGVSSVGGAFSDGTVFELNSHYPLQPAAKDTSNWALQKAFQAALATSIASGVGEFMFARPQVSYASPFASKSLHNSQVAAASHGQDLVLSKKSRPLLFSALRQTASPASQISSAASSTGLLFGTRVYLDRQQLPTLASSAIAGATLGTVQGVASILCHRPMNGSLQSPNPLLISTIARHALAATCYFAAYDSAIALLSSNDAKKSTPSIIASGALAGMVNSTVMVAGAAEQSTLRWMATSMRAAPTHALVFLIYESIKEHLQ
jgi:hypothetical protein